jgi:hypothetical protein
MSYFYISSSEIEILQFISLSPSTSLSSGGPPDIQKGWAVSNYASYSLQLSMSSGIIKTVLVSVCLASVVLLFRWKP